MIFWMQQDSLNCNLCLGHLVIMLSIWLANKMLYDKKCGQLKKHVFCLIEYMYATCLKDMERIIKTRLAFFGNSIIIKYKYICICFIIQLLFKKDIISVINSLKHVETYFISPTKVHFGKHSLRWLKKYFLFGCVTWCFTYI